MTRPSEGAPNVLVVLPDDVGFGASSGPARLVHDLFGVQAFVAPARTSGG